MKPSDRIEQIYKTKGSITTDYQDYINAQVLNWLNSIVEYLDEEWEKNQKEELEDLVLKDIESNFRSKLL